MANKKKGPTQLDLDMIECKKAGYGVHYGDWRAAQPPAKIESGIPDGWQECKRCGKLFKPKTKKRQMYCEVLCQQAAQREKDKEKLAEYKRAWREKQAAEAK